MEPRKDIIVMLHVENHFIVVEIQRSRRTSNNKVPVAIADSMHKSLETLTQEIKTKRQFHLFLNMILGNIPYQFELATDVIRQSIESVNDCGILCLQQMYSYVLNNNPSISLLPEHLQNTTHFRLFILYKTLEFKKFQVSQFIMIQNEELLEVLSSTTIPSVTQYIEEQFSPIITNSPPAPGLATLTTNVVSQNATIQSPSTVLATSTSNNTYSTSTDGLATSTSNVISQTSNINHQNLVDNIDKHETVQLTEKNQDLLQENNIEISTDATQQQLSSISENNNDYHQQHNLHDNIEPGGIIQLIDNNIEIIAESENNNMIHEEKIELTENNPDLESTNIVIRNSNRFKETFFENAPQEHNLGQVEQPPRMLHKEPIPRKRTLDFNNDLQEEEEEYDQQEEEENNHQEEEDDQQAEEDDRQDEEDNHQEEEDDQQEEQDDRQDELDDRQDEESSSHEGDKTTVSEAISDKTSNSDSEQDASFNNTEHIVKFKIPNLQSRRITRSKNRVDVVTTNDQLSSPSRSSLRANQEYEEEYRLKFPPIETPKKKDSGTSESCDWVSS